MITGADDSSINIWDLDTGLKNLAINEAHGNEEITCMALDRAGRRLVSGARNGSVKVTYIGCCLCGANKAMNFRFGMCRMESN